MQLCRERVEEILSDSNRRINTLLSPEGVKEIMEHPDNIRSPWYGQLMKAPQILAFIIEIDYWLEHYHVDIQNG